MEITERQLGVRLIMRVQDDDEYIFRLAQSKTLTSKVHSSPLSKIDTGIYKGKGGYLQLDIASQLLI